MKIKVKTLYKNEAGTVGKYLEITDAETGKKIDCQKVTINIEKDSMVTADLKGCQVVDLDIVAEVKK